MMISPNRKRPAEKQSPFTEQFPCGFPTVPQPQRFRSGSGAVPERFFPVLSTAPDLQLGVVATLPPGEWGEGGGREGGGVAARHVSHPPLHAMTAFHSDSGAVPVHFPSRPHPRLPTGNRFRAISEQYPSDRVSGNAPINPI